MKRVALYSCRVIPGAKAPEGLSVAVESVSGTPGAVPRAVWSKHYEKLGLVVLGAVLGLSVLVARDYFKAPRTELTQEQLAAFTLQVTSRYGNFVSAQVSDKRPTPLEQSWKRSMVVIPINIRFASGALEADLGLERFNEKTGKSSMVWRSLRIIDPTQGNMVFPDGEPAPPELPALDSGKPTSILKPQASNALPQTR